MPKFKSSRLYELVDAVYSNNKIDLPKLLEAVEALAVDPHEAIEYRKSVGHNVQEIFFGTVLMHAVKAKNIQAVERLLNSKFYWNIAVQVELCTPLDIANQQDPEGKISALLKAKGALTFKACSLINAWNNPHKIKPACDYDKTFFCYSLKDKILTHSDRLTSMLRLISDQEKQWLLIASFEPEQLKQYLLTYPDELNIIITYLIEQDGYSFMRMLGNADLMALNKNDSPLEENVSSKLQLFFRRFTPKDLKNIISDEKRFIEILDMLKKNDESIRRNLKNYWPDKCEIDMPLALLNFNENSINFLLEYLKRNLTQLISSLDGLISFLSSLPATTRMLWMKEFSPEQLQKLMGEHKQGFNDFIRLFGMIEEKGNPLHPNIELIPKNAAKILDQLSLNDRVHLLKQANPHWLQQFIIKEYGGLEQFFESLYPALIHDIIMRFDSTWLLDVFIHRAISPNIFGFLFHEADRRVLLKKVESANKDFLYDCLVKNVDNFRTHAINLGVALTNAPEALDFITKEQLNKIILDGKNLNLLFFSGRLSAELLKALIDKMGGNRWLESTIKTSVDLEEIFNYSADIEDAAIEALLSIFEPTFLRKLLPGINGYQSIAQNLSNSVLPALINRLGGSAWIKQHILSTRDFAAVFTRLPEQTKEQYLRELHNGFWIKSIGGYATVQGFDRILSLLPKALIDEVLSFLPQVELDALFKTPANVKALSSLALERLPSPIIYKYWHPLSVQTGVQGFFQRVVHGGRKPLLEAIEGRVESEIIFFYMLDYLALKAEEKNEKSAIHYRQRLNDFSGVIGCLKKPPEKRKEALNAFFSTTKAPDTTAHSTYRYAALRQQLQNLPEQILNKIAAEFMDYFNNADLTKTKPAWRKLLSELRGNVRQLVPEDETQEMIFLPESPVFK